MKAWIQTLNKDQLIAELASLQISTEGDIDDLRRKLRTFVSNNATYGEERAAFYKSLLVTGSATPTTTVVTPTITAVTTKMAATLLTPSTSAAAYSATTSAMFRPPPMTVMTQLSMNESVATPPAASEATATMDAAKSLSHIRKWGVYFDGKDPLGFLEQLEDLCDAAGFSHDTLLRGLPLLLKGDALLWHRNNRAFFVSWEDFRREFMQQFLPPRYQAQLAREVLSRMQRQNEPFRVFATEILTKMRRARSFAPEEQLECLYENMAPEYKFYIRRNDARSVSELSALAAEFEAIEQQRRDVRRIHEPVVAAAYSKDECCWRCKQRGHTRQFCQRPAKKFCSQCGRDGILTKDCHPPAGNASRAGRTVATSQAQE